MDLSTFDLAYNLCNRKNHSVAAINANRITYRNVICKYAFNFCLLLIIFFTYPLALAEGGIEHEKNDIIIGIPSTEPWGWRTPNGIHRGIVVDLSQKLIDKVGSKNNIVYFYGTLERVIHELLMGRIDLAYAMDDERLEKNAILLSTITPIPIEVWSLSESLIVNPENIKGKKIGIAVRDFKHHPLLAESRTFVLSTPKKLFLMLKSKRIDGILELSHLLEYFALKDGLRREDFNIIPAGQIVAKLWLSPNSIYSKPPKLERWLNAAQTVNTADDWQMGLDYYLKLAGNPEYSR